MRKTLIAFGIVAILSLSGIAIMWNYQPSHNSVAMPDTDPATTLKVIASGLPVNTNWSVALTGINVYGDSLRVTLYSGGSTTITNTQFDSIGDPITYFFNDVQTSLGYPFIPVTVNGNPYNPSSTGNYVMAQSGTTYINVTFQQSASYQLAFQVQNRPQAVNHPWTGYVTNNGTYYLAINTTATYSVYSIPNGTYYFHFNSTYQTTFGNYLYIPTPSSGYFTVSGTDYTLTISYNSIQPTTFYNVEFEPVGLPSNTTYNLVITSTYNSTMTYLNTTLGSVNLTLAGTSYYVTASTIGYTYNGPREINVNSNTIIHLNFTANGNTPIDQLSGLLSALHLTVGQFFFIILGVLSILTVIMIVRYTDDAILGSIAIIIVAWVGRGFGMATSGEAVMFTAIGVASYVLSVVLNNQPGDA